MKFLDLAKLRYSSRNYKNKAVEKERLNKILEAARIAPSAANKQPWHFIVVEEKETLKELRTTYGRDWLNTAPVIIVCCGDHDNVWIRAKDNKDHLDIDLSIAIDHMTLQATELNLATCWICHFDVEKTKKIFNLPENIEPIALLPLGYPNDDVDINRHDSKRKAISEIAHFEKW